MRGSAVTSCVSGCARHIARKAWQAFARRDPRAAAPAADHRPRRSALSARDGGPSSTRPRATPGMARGEFEHHARALRHAHQQWPLHAECVEQRSQVGDVVRPATAARTTGRSRAGRNAPRASARPAAPAAPTPRDPASSRAPAPRRARALVAIAQTGARQSSSSRCARSWNFEYRKRFRNQATSATPAASSAVMRDSGLGAEREAGNARQLGGDLAAGLAAASPAARAPAWPWTTRREWLELLSAATTRPDWSNTGTATATTP